MYQIANIPNGKISYYTVGEGLPIILLNGFSGTFLHWSPDFLASLKTKRTVYCMNYRGIGHSVANKNSISISELAEDILQFMDELNLPTCALLGYSMGGYIAQEFALSYPNRLSALHLVSTRIAGNKSISTPPEIIERMIPKELSIEERVQSRLELNFPVEFHEALRAQQRKWVEQYDLPECTLDLTMMEGQRKAIIEWQKSFDSAKYQKYEKNLDIKTFIYCGLKDLIIPYQNSIVLCGLIPNSQLTIFENGGHGLLSQFGKEIGALVNIHT